MRGVERMVWAAAFAAARVVDGDDTVGAGRRADGVLAGYRESNWAKEFAGEQRAAIDESMVSLARTIVSDTSRYLEGFPAHALAVAVIAAAGERK